MKATWHGHVIAESDQTIELDGYQYFPPASVRMEFLQMKIAAVREQMKKLKGIGQERAQAPDQQVSLIDPDARSMATSASSMLRCQTPRHVSGGPNRPWR